MKRYDVSSPRERGDKTFWVRVGTAFEDEKGTSIVFDALPLPDKDGRVSVRLFEPRPRDGGQRQQTRTYDRDLDDDAPF